MVRRRFVLFDAGADLLLGHLGPEEVALLHHNSDGELCVSTAPINLKRHAVAMRSPPWEGSTINAR